MFNLIVYGYGHRIDRGGVDHPDGGKCCLSITTVLEIDSDEEALKIGLNMEAKKYVHSVAIEPVE